MKKTIKWLARQKFRLDIASSYAAVFFMTYSAIGSSDKISTLVHLPGKVIIPVLVLGPVLGLLALGYVLDKLKFSDYYLDEVNLRNKMLVDAVKKPRRAKRTKPDES